MAQLIYDNARLEIMTNGLLPTGTEDYRLMLLGTTIPYSPNVAHDFVSDVVASEFSATNYTRKTLTSLSVSLTGSKAGLHADMVTYTDLALGDGPSFPTVAAGIVFRFVTNDADSWLVGYLDSITAVTNGDDLLVTWDTDGIVYI